MLIADQVETLIGELRLILGLLGDRLIVLRLVDHGIDLAEHVALLDVLSFGEIDRDQLAVDLRAHGHVVERAHGADAVEIDRHVLDVRRCRQHRNRQIGTCGPVGGLLLLQRGPGDVAEAAEDQKRDRDRNGAAARARGDAAARDRRPPLRSRSSGLKSIDRPSPSFGSQPPPSA